MASARRWLVSQDFCRKSASCKREPVLQAIQVSRCATPVVRAPSMAKRGSALIPRLTLDSQSRAPALRTPLPAPPNRSGSVTDRRGAGAGNPRPSK